MCKLEDEGTKYWEQARERARFGGLPEPTWYEAAEGEEPKDWQVKMALEHWAEEFGWDGQCGQSPAEWIAEHERRIEEARADQYAASIRKQQADARVQNTRTFLEALTNDNLKRAEETLSEMRLDVIRHGNAADMERLEIFSTALAAVKRGGGIKGKRPIEATPETKTKSRSKRR